jgi:hypothetical protein
MSVSAEAIQARHFPDFAGVQAQKGLNNGSQLGALME